MRHGTLTALALGLMLVACSDDGMPMPKDASANDGGVRADSGSDAGEEDAGTSSALARPGIERPPTNGLPASLRPPR